MIRNLIELGRELIDAALDRLLPRAAETCPSCCPCAVEFADDDRGLGYCTCAPHLEPMLDCGIPEHRAQARELADLADEAVAR